jgi:hypothetical protein
VNSIANRVIQGSISCITCTPVPWTMILRSTWYECFGAEWGGDHIRHELRLKSRRLGELAAACPSGPVVILQVQYCTSEKAGEAPQRVTFMLSQMPVVRGIQHVSPNRQGKLALFLGLPNGRAGSWHVLWASGPRINPAIQRFARTMKDA